MRTLIVLTVSLALIGLAAPAVAHDFGAAGFYVTPHPDHGAADPIHYAENAAVWEESNGVEGLQRCAGVDGAGRAYEADTHVAGAEADCS